jgi:hypothetical protein
MLELRKARNFRRDWKEENKKNKKQKNDYGDEFEKHFEEDGGDAFVANLATCAGESAWLIDSRDFFHMNLHWHWFLVYEKYDDGMLYLHDEYHIHIVFHGRVLIILFDGRVKGMNEVLHIVVLA